MKTRLKNTVTKVSYLRFFIRISFLILKKEQDVVFASVTTKLSYFFKKKIIILRQ